MPDDRRLVRRIQSGERRAFEEFVDSFGPRVHRLVRRYVENPTDAEDLTQEAFVRAFRFFGRYNRDMPFENWLYRIISNVFVDELRRRPKLRTQSLDQPVAPAKGGSEVLPEVADDTADPERLLFHGELDEPLQHSLNMLPHEFRQAVILADIEGLSYEEISEVMGCSLGTVRSRLHRGRKLLRNRLREQYGYTLGGVRGMDQ